MDNHPAGEQREATIAEACKGTIDPEIFRAYLTPDDLTDIESGRVSVEYLRCAAKSYARRLGFPNGEQPTSQPPNPELRRI